MQKSFGLMAIMEITLQADTTRWARVVNDAKIAPE
jgi:hypothetical protein